MSSGAIPIHSRVLSRVLFGLRHVRVPRGSRLALLGLQVLRGRRRGHVELRGIFPFVQPAQLRSPSAGLPASVQAFVLQPDSVHHDDHLHDHDLHNNYDYDDHNDNHDRKKNHGNSLGETGMIVFFTA